MTVTDLIFPYDFVCYYDSAAWKIVGEWCMPRSLDQSIESEYKKSHSIISLVLKRGENPVELLSRVDAINCRYHTLATSIVWAP